MPSFNLEADRKALKSMIILFKTYQSLVEYIKKDIDQSGFDINEFSVFEVIYHYDNITVQAIKNKVLVASSSLSYILDKLQKKQLINRIRSDQDQRIINVSLTKQGLTKALDIFPRHYDKMKEIFNVLTLEEQSALNEMLKKIGYLAKESIKWYMYILIITQIKL